MAFIRCAAAAPQASTLWTNPAPNAAFAAATITLSDDIDNYDLIKFIFKDAASGSTEVASYISPADLKVFDSSAATGYKDLIGPAYATGGYEYARRYHYVSDTSIAFEVAYRINSSGNDSNYCIPVSISGVKF